LAFISTIASFLRERGFGGLYGVGKAAEHPPALAVLSHTPAAAKERKQRYNLCMLFSILKTFIWSLMQILPSNLFLLKNVLNGQPTSYLFNFIKKIVAPWKPCRILMSLKRQLLRINFH
jgi:hypothetical protein